MDPSKLLKGLALGQGQILAPHIDSYQARAEFPPAWEIQIVNTKPDDGGFHPSGHCLLSVKQLVELGLGLSERERIGASLRRTFDCGHMWHGYLGEILIDMGFIQRKHVELHHQVDLWRLTVMDERESKGFNQPESEHFCVSGTIDLWDVQIPGRGGWLVDIKTTSKKNFDRLEQTPLYEKYLAQVSVYADMMRYIMDVPNINVLILVVEKDGPHRFREIQVPFDEDRLRTIYNRWSEATHWIAKGEVPNED